jgi:tRNA nucleotidyltransferase (CCA-adding enzyme)
MEKSRRRVNERSREHTCSVSQLLRERLSRETGNLMRRLGAEAERRESQLYVVGGLVRDLLMDEPMPEPLDLDLVVEGDALGFARDVALSHRGTCVPFPRFQTATVFLGKRLRLDIAAARSEEYTRGGALPVVRRSSIETDLYRRDFTINSMAVHLNPPNFGALIDPFGGRADIASGTVRVLHEGSFVDDPTRMLRAVRFEQRCGFGMDQVTERLLRRTAKPSLLRTVSAQRLREELVLLTKEAHATDSLLRLDALGVTPAIYPGLALGETRESLLRQVEPCLRRCRDLLGAEELEEWVVYLQVLLVGLIAERRRRAVQRLALHRRVRLVADQIARHGRRLLRILRADSAPSPSRVFFLLQPLRLECVVFLMILAPEPRVTDRVVRYLAAWRHQTTGVNGRSLQALGLPSGPAHGRILRRVLAETLDGRTPTQAAQRALAQRLVRKELGP